MTVAVPERREALLPREPVAPSGFRGRPNDWWGMLLLIATEATLFLMLLVSYFYIRYHTGPDWPPGEIKNPKLEKVSIMTVLMVSSSVPIFLGEHAIRKGNQRGLRLGLLGGYVLGLAFLALQASEYRSTLKEFAPTENAYASLFFTITGLHGAHVAAGLVLITWTLIRAFRGAYTSERHVGVQTSAIYWHFVDVVWIFILFSLYLSPYA